MAFEISNFSEGIGKFLSGKKPTIAKVKEATDDVVAGVMAKHTSAKATQIKEQLKVDSERIASEERQIKQKQQTLSTLVRSNSVLSEKYKAMTVKKKAELVAEYKEVIIKLKTHPLIDKFSVDSQNRVIVTTKPLPVKKPSWPRSKIAGLYQIKIDFAEKQIGSAIHILNCTQHYDNHDSPTISSTSPCWGNISTDIQNDFKTQDLYELVIDLIDYITSPNDNDGYITGPGATKEDKKGWEAFFNKAKKLPTGYSFTEWDKEHNSGNFGTIRATMENSIGYTIDPGMYTHYGNVTIASTASPSIFQPMMSSGQYEQLMSYQRGNNLTTAQADLAHELERHLYFRSNSARHYAELIYPNDNVHPISRIELEGEMRRTSPLHPVSAVVDFSGENSPTAEMIEEVVELYNLQMNIEREGNGDRIAMTRYALNPEDLIPEGLAVLRRSQHIMYRPRHRDPRDSDYQAREQVARELQNSMNNLTATQAAMQQQMASNPYISSPQRSTLSAQSPTFQPLDPGNSGPMIDVVGNLTWGNGS